MKKLNESYIEVKNSKFIGILYEINDISEVENIIENTQKEHKKARHIVYSYKKGILEKNFADKEPSGTTRGLIDLIHIKNLDNVLIIIVRYFGGTKLGSGLLTRTYTKCASLLINE